MSNWAKLQEELVGKPVFKRAKHGIHFQNADGSITANFSGAPCHYIEAGIWKPIDTALIAKGNGFYGAHHSDVLIHTDGRVKVGNYLQLSELVGAKPGKVDGDRVVREFGFGVQYLYMKEDGFRQETVIERIPTKAEARYLIATESGQLPGHYRRSDITATDADGDVHEFVNLGQFKKWLDKAKYPVVIDPDFNAGAKFWRIWGQQTDYATALSTSTSYEGDGTVACGQQKSGINYLVFRNYVKFDTSSIDDSATVSQVNIKFAVTNDSSTVDFDVVIKKYNWSAFDAAQNSDTREPAYDGLSSASADDSIWRNTSGISINTYYTSGNLDTSWVSKTGVTYYGLQSSRDISASAPSGNEFVVFGKSTDANYRPVLTVTYTAGGVPKQFMHYQRLRSL